MMPRFTINSNLLDTSINSRIKPEMIKAYISSVYAKSPLIGAADSFIKHATENGIMALEPIAHSIEETGWGRHFVGINNGFGINAPSYDPGRAYNFPSLDNCISYYCSWIKRSYLMSPAEAGLAPGKSHWAGAPTLAAMNVHYAEDKTWCYKIVAIMNSMAAFIEKNYYSNAVALPPAQSVPQPLATLPTGIKTYIIKHGGWRSQVVQEIINSGIWQGTWQDNIDRFDQINSGTPQGGYKPGNIVYVDNVSTSVPTLAPAPVVDYIEVPVNKDSTLGSIFKQAYGKYPNWTDWRNNNPQGDLQRAINFARAHGSVINGKDTIYTGTTIKFPKNI